MSNELLPGTILYDYYKISECICTAEFSNIYIAEDLNENNKKVIIKELLHKAIGTNDRAKALEKFQEEIDIYKKLNHPNMAKIIESFSSESAVYTENKQFIVMEYIQGKTLRKIKEEQKEDLSPDDAGKWLGQIMEVIKYLSEQNPSVVFYYLTPDHVMITDEGQIKLINFGLGRFFRTGPFKSNQYMGIAGYAAPEQYGIKPVDNRADIFGAGAVIYYMLTQDDPEKHALNFSPVRTLNPMVSMQFARFISKCVQMKAEDRCENINEVIEKLNSITFSDTQVNPDKIKKKEEIKVKKVQPKQVVGKELEGWHQTIWWKIETHPVLGNKGFQAGLLILLIVLIYIAWYKRDIVISSLKNAPPSLVYAIKNNKNISVIDLNTLKVSSHELEISLVDAVYSDKLTNFYGITQENKLVEIRPGRYTITREKIIGSEPSCIILSKDKKIAYITNKRSGSINIVDLTTFNDIVPPVLTGAGPTKSVISSDGKTVYIFNSLQNSVSIFNTETNTIKNSLVIGDGVEDLALNADNSKLYLVNYKTSKIVIMDIKDKKVINEIEVKNNPVGIATNPMVDEFYVAADKSNMLQFLNINGVIKDEYPLDFIPIKLLTGLNGIKIYISGRTLSGYVISEFDTLKKKFNSLDNQEKEPAFLLTIYNWQ